MLQGLDEFHFAIKIGNQKSASREQCDGNCQRVSRSGTSRVCRCEEQTPATERVDGRRCAAGEDADSRPLRFRLLSGRFGNVHRAYFREPTARSLGVEAVGLVSVVLQEIT